MASFAGAATSHEFRLRKTVQAISTAPAYRPKSRKASIFRDAAPQYPQGTTLNLISETNFNKCTTAEKKFAN